MEIQTIDCASCGAPLKISPNAQTVRCEYCGAELLVKRDDGESSTEIIEQISAINESLSETKKSLHVLKLEQRLTNTQVQLSDVQGEIRTLLKGHKSRKAKRRLKTLRQKEILLLQDIEIIHQQLVETGDPALLETDLESVYQGTLAGSYGDKNWTLTFILCLMVGIFGVHRFYVGKLLTGFIQFMTFGGFGVWWLIDLYLIGTGKFRDKDGYLLADPKIRLGRSLAWGMIVFMILTVILAPFSSSNMMIGVILGSAGVAGVVYWRFD